MQNKDDVNTDARPREIGTEPLPWRPFVLPLLLSPIPLSCAATYFVLIFYGFTGTVWETLAGLGLESLLLAGVVGMFSRKPWGLLLFAAILCWALSDLLATIYSPTRSPRSIPTDQILAVYCALCVFFSLFGLWLCRCAKYK